MLRLFVPRMRDRSTDVSEARSIVTGRIVDTYTNILTLKLFARAREEDAYVRSAVETHTGMFHASLRLNTLFSLCLATLNAMMVTSTAGIAIYLWTQGVVDGRHGGDGVAARLADRHHRRLGRVPGHRHFRECRRGAGRHERDRKTARPGRQAGRQAARGHARRNPFRRYPLRLWQRERPDRRAVARR